MSDPLGDWLPQIPADLLPPTIHVVEVWKQTVQALQLCEVLEQRQAWMSEERFQDILSRPARSWRRATAWRFLPPPPGSATRDRYGR